MLQEVCTQDSLFDVGYHKHPTEGATKPDVERAGVYTIGRYTRTVNSKAHRGCERSAQVGGITLTSAPV